MAAIFQLVKTCEACPEQYDVYHNGEKVAYLRMRHGAFRADCRDVTVYRTTAVRGDGMFADDAERDFYLGIACRRILEQLGMKENGLYEIEDRCGGE